jgi:hypothetical protein
VWQGRQSPRWLAASWVVGGRGARNECGKESCPAARAFPMASGAFRWVKALDTAERWPDLHVPRPTVSKYHPMIGLGQFQTI